MKADHRKHLEQNELASRLTRWWKGTGETRSSSTTWGIVGAALLVIVLIIAWRYYNESGSRVQAAIWPQIEDAASESELKSIVESNRGTNVGRIAKAQLARLQLNSGLNKLGSYERSQAIGNIEEARTAYTELITEAKDPLLQREAMLAAAQAEEALVGIPKSDSPTEGRGSLDKALELYERTTKEFDKTPQGNEAAARAKDIRENKAKIQEMYDRLNAHFGPVEPNKKGNEQSPLDSFPPIPPAFGPEPTAPGKPSEPTKPFAPPPGEPTPKTQATPETNPLAPPPGKPKDDKAAGAKPKEPGLSPPPAAAPDKKESPAKPDQPKSDKPQKPKGV